jgi:hypothetical protein
MSDWAYFQKVRRFQKHILLTLDNPLLHCNINKKRYRKTNYKEKEKKLIYLLKQAKTYLSKGCIIYEVCEGRI